MTDVDRPTSLKAAVIGVGNIGFHHARIYHEHPDVTLTAIIDRDEERLTEVANHYDVEGFLSYQEMLKHQSPDLISLATPTETHYRIAKDLLGNGINVFVEKPITTQTTEAKHLCSLSGKNDLFLGIGLIERYNPVVNKAKHLLESGVIGRPITIDIKRVGGYPPKLTQTGVYMDLGIHDVDIVSYLMDALPLEMNVEALRIHNETVEDACVTTLRYNNCTAVIQNNWVSPVKIRQISITGTKGLLEVNLITQQINHFDHNVDPDKFHHESSYGEFIRRYGNPTSKVIKVEKQEPLKNELNHVIGVVTGKNEYNISHDHIIALTNLMETHAP